MEHNNIWEIWDKAVDKRDWKKLEEISHITRLNIINGSNWAMVRDLAFIPMSKIELYGSFTVDHLKVLMEKYEISLLEISPIFSFFTQSNVYPSVKIFEYLVDKQGLTKKDFFCRGISLQNCSLMSLIEHTIFNQNFSLLKFVWRKFGLTYSELEEHIEICDKKCMEKLNEKILEFEGEANHKKVMKSVFEELLFSPHINQYF